MGWKERLPFLGFYFGHKRDKEDEERKYIEAHTDANNHYCGKLELAEKARKSGKH